MDEQRLKDQEQILDAVVSVREIVNFIESDRYLSLIETSEYLAMSTRTIRDRLDEIPHYRVGTKMLLFKKSELDEWMFRFREGGKAELDELVNNTLENLMGD